MAIYREDIANVELSSGQIFRSFMNHTIGSGDELANRFGVRVFRNGEPENIGGTCMGLFIRADGTTVTISSGVVSGNVAYVTLPEACYAVEGQFSLAIKCQGSGVTGTLRIVDGVVSRTSTSAVVDPGTLVPSIEDLIDAIEDAVETIPADYSGLWTTLAPAFSTSTEYKAGQYVTYDGKMYKFTTDHAAGTWNTAHVTQVNVGGETSDLKSAINPNLKAIAGLSAPIYGHKKTETATSTAYQYTNIITPLFAGVLYRIKVARSEAAPTTIRIHTANDWQYVDERIASIPAGESEITFSYIPSANAANLRIGYAESSSTIVYTADVETVIIDPVVKMQTKLVGVPKYGYMQNGVYAGEADSSSYQTLWFDVEGLDTVTIDYDKSAYYDTYDIIDKDGNTAEYEANSYSTHVTKTVALNVKSKYIVIGGNNETKLQYASVTAEKPTISGNLKGKKIVWFGTSIPAAGKYGLNNINSYPMRLGAMLGATVYNEAVGSSTVHCRRSNYVSAENPYGFIEPFDAVSRSMSNTLQMQEWVIENFEFFRNHPTTLSNDDKDFIRSCSYENKLDHYLTTATEPDLWVFDHGYNDYLGSEADYSESDPYSTFTYQGAMNFLINRIKQYNPHAKIIIIGHYDKQRSPNVVTYQQAVATRWEFPIVNLFDEMGWNDKTLVTKGFWRNGMWHTKGTNDQTITYINIWCADDLHPHSDATGKALDFYARMLFEYFKNVLL